MEPAYDASLTEFEASQHPFPILALLHTTGHGRLVEVCPLSAASN